MLNKACYYLLPPQCILCGYSSQQAAICSPVTMSNAEQLHTNICLPCRKNLPILPQGCRQCAQFLHSATEALLCADCLTQAPPFDKIYALFPYVPPITAFIIQLKFYQQLTYAKAFSQLFLDRIKSHWYRDRALPDLIVPMPLHRIRLRQRGFNQAVEIAKPLAKQLSLPLDLTGIVRIKPTLAQSALSAKARKQNMRRAFAAKRCYTGLNIAVLDDVITTGHTMTAFCQVLKQYGARHIDVWCCAIAQEKNENR